MKQLSVELLTMSGFAHLFPLIHDPRLAPIVPLLNRSIVPSLPLPANYFLIVTGKDGGAPNKERPSPQASPCMAVVAMAAATTTILALVAGLVAALRMMHMSADRRSGTSESVANITKADNNDTIKVA